MPDKRFTKVSFYIVAHADDWQLFMQPNVYNDLVSPDTKAVFIITTAGDAGFDQKFWTAREEGMKSSLRFCLAPLSTIQETSGTLDFNGHTIHYATVNKARCHFLRLPDGNIDGNGFKKNGYQSLSGFKSGLVNAITAVDNSTTYQSWTDLHSTLEQIILSERTGISDTWINYLNPDTSTNPNDHSDHIATGSAIKAMQIISSVKQAIFVGYSVCSNQHSLHPSYMFWKTGMFAAYEKAVFDATGYSTLKEGVEIYMNWCVSTARFITVVP